MPSLAGAGMKEFISILCFSILLNDSACFTYRDGIYIYVFLTFLFIYSQCLCDPRAEQAVSIKVCEVILPPGRPDQSVSSTVCEVICPTGPIRLQYSHLSCLPLDIFFSMQLQVAGTARTFTLLVVISIGSTDNVPIEWSLSSLRLSVSLVTSMSQHQHIGSYFVV